MAGPDERRCLALDEPAIGLAVARQDGVHDGAVVVPGDRFVGGR